MKIGGLIITIFKLFFFLGHYGTGKTLMGSEAVKIMWAFLLAAGKEVEIHGFVYDETLNVLKSDLEERWFFEFGNFDASDLKVYSHIYRREHEIKPDEKNLLLKYDDSPNDFIEALQYAAKKFNQSGKTHIIFMDEINLNNMISENSNDKLRNVLEVDLSFISKFENVYFVLCLRPMSEYSH